MQNSLEYFKKALQIKRLLSYMVEDFIRSRYVLLLSLLFAMITLLIYMFLLRYFARWIIWLSLILCIIVFALAASFCFTARSRIIKYSKNNNNTLPDLDEMNITFNANAFDTNQTEMITITDLTNKKISTLEKFDTAMFLLDEFAPMSIVWLILGITCCVICCIIMICTCCLCERLSLASGKGWSFNKRLFEVFLQL
jgi:ABC-type multidrug transport system fused ATPase/permease subunit